jgi:Tfp pilus assembly pilus retraction ATPase PilT
VSNLIREAKNHHIFNIMLTQKVQGNQLLNDQLEQLVRDGKAEYDEALLKSLDKVDLAKRFGKEYFEK